MTLALPHRPVRRGTSPDAGEGTTFRLALSPRQVWGLLFTAPYIAVFLSFVVFPVGYAFWLAGSPHLYVELADDPIFLRTVVNTLVFLIVAINIKMVIALLLSGFFTHRRWWVKVLAVLF